MIRRLQIRGIRSRVGFDIARSNNKLPPDIMQILLEELRTSCFMDMPKDGRHVAIFYHGPQRIHEPFHVREGKLGMRIPLLLHRGSSMDINLTRKGSDSPVESPVNFRTQVDKQLFIAPAESSVGNDHVPVIGQLPAIETKEGHVLIVLPPFDLRCMTAEIIRQSLPECVQLLHVWSWLQAHKRCINH